MAKIILKCRYLKPGSSAHSQNLIKYIAKRDGVDKIDDTWKCLPVSSGQKKLIKDILHDFPDAKSSYEYQDYLSAPTRGNASEFISRAIEENVDLIAKRENYVQYIAKRPRVEKYGSHGLFTDANVHISLDNVAKEVSEHQGIVWTNILSLRREDAARLGFEKGEAWRDLIRGQAEKMAEAMKIPLEDLRWYAAFHNESHHPHCHIVAYSAGKEPYMSQQGMLKLKASFAREIFKQDRIQLYELQTQFRDDLNLQARDIVAEIIQQINSGRYQDEATEAMMIELNKRLQSTKGKKVYGYLPEPMRNLVNGIIDELAKDSRISSLYDLWYDQQCQITRIYQDTAPKKIPLSQNKVFQPIRNAVIKEAMGISLIRTQTPIADDEISDDSSVVDSADAPTLVDTQPFEIPLEPSTDDRLPPPHPEDGDKNRFSFTGFRKKDNWWSDQYKAARHFLYGTKSEPPDHGQAFVLLQEEAQKGNGLAKYDLGRMYLLGLGCDKDESVASTFFRDALTAFEKMEQTARNADYWQYRIGKLYAYGYGVEQDYSTAATWFEKAVASNNPFAAYSLAGQFYRGQGVNQDDSRAFDLYSMAANHSAKPNAYAQYQLGLMWRDGIGTEVDKATADSWYTKAYQGFLRIEQDMADDKLYYRLGSMNLHGTGTPIDRTQAKEYFEKAAQLGNIDALYGLGKLYLDNTFEEYNTAKAIFYLTRAANENHTFAQYTLGKLLFKGEVTERNIQEALRWLQKASDADNSYAKYLLGKTLVTGDGIEANIAQGMELLKQAAELNNMYAHYFLGKILADGIITPQEIREAIYYLTSAAEKEFAPAQYRLAKLYLSLPDNLENTQHGLYWLEKAVVKENQYAQYQLGKMLLYGQRIDKDIDRGLELLRASAAQGNEYATRIINNYGRKPVGLASIRLLASLTSLFRENIERDQKTVNLIDRKLRRKIEEKKQAQGIRMG